MANPVTDFFKNIFTQDPTTTGSVQDQLEQVEVAGRSTFNSIYNIDAFKTQNFIRSAKFAARFTSIPGFATEGIQNFELRKLSYLCDSIEFPGQALTAVDYRIPGKLKIKVPYLREINEVSFTLYVNNEVPLYKMMNTWIAGISPNTAQNRYFDEIVGSIDLIQFEDTTYLTKPSSNALKNMTVKLIDLYPLNIQSMPANWMDDGYHKVNVSFYFRDLEIIV